MSEERRIGHHGQVRSVEFEAHVHLFGDAIQQLRQSLVYGIEGDVSGNARVDVNVELRVTGQREQQILHFYVVDDDAVGFRLRNNFV